MQLKYSTQASSDSPSMKIGSRKQSTDPSAQARVIQNRIIVLQEKWDKLNDLLSVRKTRLEESIQSQQVSYQLNIIMPVSTVDMQFQYLP